MKQCSRCGETFPRTAEYFYREKRVKDGLQRCCKRCFCEYNRQRYALNRKREIERCHRWREQNPEKRRESLYRWREQNPDKYREYNLKYCQQHRLHRTISHGIYQSLRAAKNGYSWESLLGYTCDELMSHLESQFTKGMTWDNYGEWHIDHIRPISDFTFTSYENPEFHECWSLWNMQPLWGKDNMSKGSKCEKPPLPLLTDGG